MRYISTRGNSPSVSAAEAITLGMVPEGGLFLPQEFPSMPPQYGKSYQELAKSIFKLYLTDFTEEEIAAIVGRAYNDNSFPRSVAPLVRAGEMNVLELWHGPTAAFKDMALQILPLFMTASRRKCGDEKELVILVATSGDTGKAALEGFKDVEHIRIICFYPKDGVSALQERQMLTTAGGNTKVIGVKGNFDDCQTAVKGLFADAELKELLAAHGIAFSSANSINWGRLLPQIVYYYHGYAQMVAAGRINAGEPINITVPTGNFGNILAAYYAARMGLPVNKFICASNENNVLTDGIMQGIYCTDRPFCKTTSPSMDILVSSNFERLLYELCEHRGEAVAALMSGLSKDHKYEVPAAVRQDFYGGFADSAQAAAVIKHYYEKHGYLADPHTAVALAVAEAYREQSGDTTPMLVASTANPYKFPVAVCEALGIKCDEGKVMQAAATLSAFTSTDMPKSLSEAAGLPILHDTVIDKADISACVRELLLAE